MAITAMFSSVAGGAALRSRVTAAIRDAAIHAETSQVEVNIMTFAFTDREIFDVVVAAARQPQLRFRLLADWTQRARDGRQQLGRLDDLGLNNVTVKYKKDRPYQWDPVESRLRWSYRQSRGMLHHKTLSVVIDGRLSLLLSGSGNWSSKSANSYETLLVVDGSSAGGRDLLTRMDSEFRALWSDRSAALSASAAQAHYEAMAAAARLGGNHLTQSVPDVVGGAEELQSLTAAHGERPRPPDTPKHGELGPDVTVAFNARRADDDRSYPGYAEDNRDRDLITVTPGGHRKRVPLTITTLALDVIHRARPDESLLVAMYGLSVRVPEFGALLDAARSGVRLRIILDRNVGAGAAASLVRARDREALPIELSSGHRMMHQKYLVSPDQKIVLAGTANMSTDASTRHSEHRIRVAGDPELTAQFVHDFETIWRRVNIGA